MDAGEYLSIRICYRQVKRKHCFFQKQTQHLVPAGNMLRYRTYRQTHRIINLVLIVKFEEVHFFINEIFIAFEEFGEED